MRFLNLGHSDTLLVTVSSPQLKRCYFSSNHLKASMWSSWIAKKNTTHVMYIAMLRDGSKKVMKLSKQFGKGFEIGVMEERENGLTKKIDVEMFFSSIKIESLSSS
jgi:hypothetical protein